MLIPVESELETLNTDDFFELSQALSELEEKRKQAAIRMVEYYRRAFLQKEKLVKSRAFRKAILSFDELLRRES